MFFNLRKPRGFRHTFIYVDEQREQLRQLREAVAQRTAEHEQPTGASSPSSLHGAFRIRRSSRSRRSTTGLFLPIACVVLLLMLMWFLFV